MQVQKTLVEWIASEFSRLNFDNIALEDSIETINYLCREFMPSGSGFNSGTTFDVDRSKRDSLVFQTGFHHMNTHGFYDGWTYHAVTIKPDWYGFKIHSISGRDRNGIKDFIGDAFEHALSLQVSAEWDSVERRMIYKHASI